MMRKAFLIVLLAVLAWQLFVAVALADKPPPATIALLNEPQSPGYAEFNATLQGRSVKHPFFWLRCHQDGIVSGYVASADLLDPRPSAVGGVYDKDGTTFTLGIPTGAFYWQPGAGPATCLAQVWRYELDPDRLFPKLIPVEVLGELTFEVEVR